MGEKRGSVGEIPLVVVAPLAKRSVGGVTHDAGLCRRKFLSLFVRRQRQAYRKTLIRIRFFLISAIGNGYANILDFLETFSAPQLKNMPLSVLASISAERSRAMSGDDIRRRALQRLYDRRHAVEVLIRSLEGYEQCHKPCATASIDVIAARKCS